MEIRARRMTTAKETDDSFERAWMEQRIEGVMRVAGFTKQADGTWTKSEPQLPRCNE
jgi:hypothetical protein